jgi:adenylylsulfate kinase-like enzyme
MHESDALDARRIRAAKNQSLFREVNERIEHLAGTASSVTFLCECLHEECDERISMTREEYETVRARPNRFFVLEGHADADIEETVERHDRYLVVSKLGAGGELAVSLDPRSRNGRRVD